MFFHMDAFYFFSSMKFYEDNIFAKRLGNSNEMKEQLEIKFIGKYGIYDLIMNQLSKKTKEENLLRTKVKSFQKNFSQTQQRDMMRSSLSNLVGKLYSNSNIVTYSPRKLRKSNTARSISSSNLLKSNQKINPQENQTYQAIDGLTLRASHVPCLIQINTKLLLQKKELEHRITNFKEKIVKEKKSLNICSYNCKKNQNEIQHFSGFFNDAKTKAHRLEDQIQMVSREMSELTVNINQLKSRIHDRQNEIKNERKECHNLDTFARSAKVHSLQEEKALKTIKEDLMKDQRVMKSSCTSKKQLQNEKAVLLLQMNKFVSDNKI